MGPYWLFKGPYMGLCWRFQIVGGLNQRSLMELPYGALSWSSLMELAWKFQGGRALLQVAVLLCLTVVGADQVAVRF